MRRSIRFYALPTAVALFAAMAWGATSAIASGAAAAHHQGGHGNTATPIKHLVVIFDENVSFDHYFGTYPYAPNPPAEPAFHAKPGTPQVNGLYSAITKSGPVGPLLTNNPNGSNPVRLDHNDPETCDQDHDYTPEQLAADHGAEDQYPANTGNNLTLAQCLAGHDFSGSPETVPAGTPANNAAVMDYYDGNSVTGLWNYAQHDAMSDNSYGTTYGPSTPGALNVTAAQTYGEICGPVGDGSSINNTPCSAPAGLNTSDPASSDITAGPAQPAGTGTVIGDDDPTYDICSYLPGTDRGDGDTPASTITMGGNNIGDELSSSKITWGWFEGGFDNGYVPGTGMTQPTTAQICAGAHKNVGGVTETDYSPHHEPFEYYASTANPMHLPPASVAAVGHPDQANHQYDVADFWAAADAGNLPAVSYLKAPRYQDGHANNSDPLDEQTWLVSTINHLESLRTWKSTAVLITWDDSDGWYDSILGPIETQSQTPIDTANGSGDALTGDGQCGSVASQVPQTSTGAPEQGRCGLGPRLPFLVVSPFAKSNYVSSTLTDQSSVVKFIEYNWHLPALGNGAADALAGSVQDMFDFRDGGSNRPLFLDPATGEPITARSWESHHQYAKS
jgi:phospholipase C